MATDNRPIQASDWLSLQEGKLSVDVIEDDKRVIVRSAIAGVTAADLQLHLTEDMLTIRGERAHGCKETAGEVHVQECHWGAFSRTIILPCRVNPDKVEATIKRGILTIRMKKLQQDRAIPIVDADAV